MDIVFGKKWFGKYQKRLLWLLNSKWTKRWFRWCLRIRKYDCPIDTVINQITPNSFSYNAKRVSKKKVQLTTDFRTHDKYSKRLYFAFKPFWYLLHFFDWAMLDRVEALAKLNFGFLTLTQYPGSIGAGNPTDGNVERNATENTWASIRDGAGTAAEPADASCRCTVQAGGTSNLWTKVQHSYYCFDTSALTAGATISAAVLSLWGKNHSNELYSPVIHIASSSPASTSTLATTDFQNVGRTSFANMDYATFTLTQYNDFTLDANGIANVSKTGISQFSAQLDCDINDTPPTWSGSVAASFVISGAATAGTSNDPKLVVTYSLGGADTRGAKLFTLLGVGV